ncbi:golgi uridine diphosphate-N- acetylglucosamine transporter [Coemansia thaxteri]|uniref:Golgi uridine diphosphate-N- acetylglucosamine transporter n=1 Tax=Coemansia thaxteri TaxID=2663907 RepID=A0A9W8BQH3_9FUNG|nr:golgi uridine diphosphate-N- acetylglucosamine transporter [Coemansia thaxteri]KAJ2488162.1 golgi uridine diphosphate-N- acetylglucosamine transporter [Coemansia sp. RSA 2320]
MVGLYFCVSVVNNLALGFKISIPLHIVFRSGGLIANMMCGYFVANKRYPVKQVVAVVMVSAGVVIATLASVSGNETDISDKVVYGVHESVIGIALLTIGVALAAMLGLYQEATYRIFGKHWKEGLFYNHALALPMFLLFRSDIASQARALSQSRPVSLDALPWIGPWLGSCLRVATVPSLWISLGANVLSQLVCVSGVHRMTSMSSSLTLNVVLNLRKLVSLVISVLLFKNPLTPGTLLGCILVFLGTFAYSQTSPRQSTDTPLLAAAAAELSDRANVAAACSSSVRASTAKQRQAVMRGPRLDEST